MYGFLQRFFILFLAFSLPGVAYAQEEVSLPGWIAYIGEDYNVYALDLEGHETHQLTSNADQTRRYQWPTWSTDGRLAYFSIAIADAQITTNAYVSSDASEQGTLAYSGPEVFNYAYWSPGNCAAGADCRDLAILFSSPARGMFVELVRDGLSEQTSLTAGLGGPPFYYSWSPDGRRMLWQRNNQRFDIYDANTDRVIETLAQIPGAILSPAWSPVDDRLLVGAMNENNATDLMVVDAGTGKVETIASDFANLISYSWSPDGSRVAYREADSQGFGPVIVVDAATIETVARSTSTGGIAFFWSPDSQHIAYLTLAPPPGSFNAFAPQIMAQVQQQPVGVAWTVLDVDNGDERQFSSFLPTPETIYLMQYFDQFAQSHRVWSPDSQHLVYSELTEDGPVINLLDITQSSSVPFSVAEGFIGIWSFE